MAVQLLKIVLSLFFAIWVAAILVGKRNDDDWPQGGAAA